MWRDAPHEYQSLDLDFLVHSQPAHSGAGNAVLTKLGYQRSGQMYVHPANQLTLEFPRGPFGIGGDPMQSWDTVRRGKMILHVIDRTDCVRDRLAAFYFWNDRQSILVALKVARSGPIAMKRIEDWSRREGEREKFQEFKATARNQSD